MHPLFIEYQVGGWMDNNTLIHFSPLQFPFGRAYKESLTLMISTLSFTVVYQLNLAIDC